MTANATVYVDISSNNGTPNLAAHWAAGYRRLMLKATEGTGYAWAGMPMLARQWHSFGADARVGYYHWLYGTLSATAQYSWFWSHVAPVWRAGDWMMTDFEDVDPSRWVSDAQHAAVVREFDQLCAQHGPIEDYAPDWYLANLPACVAYFRGRPIVASDYSHNPPLNRFGLPLVAHQFTDRASVPGMPGPVDANRRLAGESTSGSGTPVPIPSGDQPMSASEVQQVLDAISKLAASLGLVRSATVDSMLPAVANTTPRIVATQAQVADLHYGELDPDVGTRVMVAQAIARLATLQAAVDNLAKQAASTGSGGSGGPIDIQPVLDAITKLPVELRAIIAAQPLTLGGTAK